MNNIVNMNDDELVELARKLFHRIHSHTSYPDICDYYEFDNVVEELENRSYIVNEILDITITKIDPDIDYYSDDDSIDIGIGFGMRRNRDMSDSSEYVRKMRDNAIMPLGGGE